ncbi:hypothetical protein GCM10028815_16120 [Mariniluteicoccus flavus]
MVALLLLGSATPAYAKTIAPTPLPRDATPRTYPIQSATDLTHRQESRDGRQQTAESTTSLDVVIEASVLFGKDSDVLGPNAAAALDEVARRVTARRGSGRLEVVGFTDDLGSDAHGLDLSRRRAAHVAAYLRPRVPAGTAVTEQSRGEADPRVPNTSEENRAKNRRVELHLR